jgi:DNA-binding NarL/FixJ family response regulator
MDVAHSCGAQALDEQARQELRATGARPRRVAVTGASALTPSEERVARMAAEGMRNHDIAQKLFVTPKTVEVHLSSAYRKLGIASRPGLPSALTDAR